MMADWRRGASTIALSLMLLFAGPTSTIAVAQDDPLEALLRSVFEAMDTNCAAAIERDGMCLKMHGKSVIPAPPSLKGPPINVACIKSATAERD